MITSLISSSTDVKLFADLEKLTEFLVEKGSERLYHKEVRSSSGLTFVHLLPKYIVVFVNLSKHKTPIQLQSTLVHESVHVVRALQKGLSMRGLPDEEVDAYMIDHIYTNLAEQLVSLGVDLSFTKHPTDQVPQ